jgi:hypothetical protein
MIAATRLVPAQTDNTHYGIRVTFQMPPSQAIGSATAAQQQALQFYSDSNIPTFTNYGFCYLDGAYPGGASTYGVFTGNGDGVCAGGSLSIASVVLATASLSPGATNQIDIYLSGDPGAATNPTIALGAMRSGNGVTIWGVANAHLFMSNVANKDCTQPANPGLSGKFYANALCGAGNNYMIDFAAPSFITLGQTLTTAW